MEEEWLDVLGFEGLYKISNWGRVKSLERITIPKGEKARRKIYIISERILSTRPTGPYGYLGMTLYKDAKKHDRKTHLLVLEAFIGPRPDGLVGCHNDGVVTNNTLSNLRWDTQAKNIQDSVNQKTHKESRKTTCPRNHPYDRAYANGNRYCSLCKYINKAIREGKYCDKYYRKL